MNTQNPLVAGLKLLVVAMAIVTLTGVTSVQAAALPNQITVHSQDLNTGIITLDTVTAAADGWIVIYQNPNFISGEIVGYARVQAGTTDAVKVTIDTNKVADQSTLWARLHVDNQVPGLFEWGLKDLSYNDGPVMQNGQAVVAAFGTAERFLTDEPAAVSASAPGAPVRPTTNSLVIDSQELNSGVIIVDTVSAVADGWIVIYKNPNFTDSEIVGYAPVQQGVTTNVKVTINTGKVGDKPTLWARLHVDNEVAGLFEWAHAELPDNDAPVVQNGQYVTTAFGTTGQ